MSTTTPRVSIGVPVYNGEQFLRQALDALLVQSFRDLEIVISDNGSTDGTQMICAEYAARDPRIRYYRSDRNRGGAWNRNRVFHLSSAEYFMWHDHDDMIAPDLIERCVAVLDAHPEVVACHANTLIIDEHGRKIREYDENLHLMSNSAYERYKSYHYHDRDCPLCSIYFGLTRRDVLAQTPLIGPYVNSEANLMSELALRGRFYELPEHLFFRRDHPGISTRRYKTHAERMAWFDPAKLGKGAHPGWRMFYEQVRSVTRVPMAPSDKVRCYLFAGRYFGWLAQGSLRNMSRSLRQRLSQVRAHS